MNRRIFLVFAVCALAVLSAAGSARAANLQGLGVVYLHGKGGWPGALDGGILQSLQDEGALVAAPEMPWSFRRKYAATYEKAMAEIAGAVAGLRSAGATRIAIIGHSLGANAAIGYAARHPDIAAVVALAAGHLPETDGLRRHTREAVAQAKQLVAAGKGDVPQHFPDLAQGLPFPATATPTVYLSMFDPDGPAVIPKNAAAMGPVPLLWVVGTLDPIFRRGREYAFTAAAKSPKSRYVEVFAGHLTTPLAARKRVIEWLKSL
jgi:pimeloyl-ACP methyl ester carboxylesterase